MCVEREQGEEGVCRVLVVDDDNVQLELVGYLLKRQGIVARCCPSGDAALQLVECEKYAAVLTDYQMPAMNGIEFIRALRLRCPALPVALVSAQLTDDVQREALAAGAVGAYRKPTTLAELLTLIGGMVGDGSPVTVH
ncbi:hypothetical protein GURASL_25530 [Geotalea uraniireducens]|uniref:Response regulatory domain-containing protein n=1 Tax=Geotalea uraniireducens TaxID=351604 RepID=A0ABM8EMG7_9BACT|nr:response regulator [Geotalea uraniireducens]BDV43630.1 hypothetical protein GURASL_25530 [Geotalea uraniireducens]